MFVTGVFSSNERFKILFANILTSITLIVAPLLGLFAFLQIIAFISILSTALLQFCNIILFRFDDYIRNEVGVRIYNLNSNESMIF